ncbi:MAG: heme-binding protein [Actinobacteria bacterium]|nr:heme-binding protein [Actinomycetota bacterium]
MSALTTTRRHITLLGAQRLLQAAVEHSESIGVPMSVSVCDSDGTELAFARMDGCPLLAVRISKQKAWSAISFNMSTEGWWEFIKDDPPLLHGIVHQEDLIVFPGGVPITVGDEVVGGIGVSGGHYSQDLEVAQTASGAVDLG